MIYSLRVPQNQRSGWGLYGAAPSPVGTPHFPPPSPSFVSPYVQLRPSAFRPLLGNASQYLPCSPPSLLKAACVGLMKGWWSGRREGLDLLGGRRKQKTWERKWGLGLWSCLELWEGLKMSLQVGLIFISKIQCFWQHLFLVWSSI